jgi:hypothetical protein
MFTFPFGIKTKHTVHKKIIIKCQQNLFDKELKEFNESNHIHVPKRTSRDKKRKKNKTGKRK